MPKLQGDLAEVTEAKEKEKQRADALQAIQDKEAAQTELVSENPADLVVCLESESFSHRR